MDNKALSETLQVIIMTERASSVELQRMLKIGYAEAATRLDELHELGLVGEHKGTEVREIYKGKIMKYIMGI